MQTQEFYCAACGNVAGFVAPPCTDGHGADCPEWTCARCDAAILVEPARPLRTLRRSRTATRRPTHPRSARRTAA